MKAVVLEGQGLIAHKDVPTPEPRAGHVRLQVEAVSICGSDIKRYVDGHRSYPMILGHECSGVIDKVGDGVEPGLVGKHAAMIPVVPCFDCEQCRRGYYSACHNYSFIGSRQAGGLAEFVEMSVRNALLIPDDLPFEYAALIEPTSVARHMLALGGFAEGQSAIVFGAGSIGLMLVQWLRILGASQIVSVDVVDDNLETAQRLGAHVTLNPLLCDVVDRVRELTGDGVDLALEAAGAPQALEQCVPVTRPRGKVICGGNQPLDKTLPMSFIEAMMRRELSLIGCFMSYSAPFPGHEWTDTVAEMQAGSLDMETMISHRFPLVETPRVFAEIGAHTLTHRKIILRPKGAAA